MADVSSWTTLTGIVKHGSNVGDFTAGAAIKAGQVVGLVDTGVDMTVHPLNASAGDSVVGVAITAATCGAPVSAAMVGCIALVANADDSTAIDAGHWVECSGIALGGIVSESSIAETGDGVQVMDAFVVGKLVTDMAGGGTAYCYILPTTITRANTS